MTPEMMAQAAAFVGQLAALYASVKVLEAKLDRVLADVERNSARLDTHGERLAQVEVLVQFQQRGER